MPPTDWRTRAACIGKDPELWFPSDNAARARSDVAKAICTRCTVQVECLQLADDLDARYGIWSGLDEDERDERRTRKPRRPPAARKAPQQGTPRPKPKRPMVHGTKSGYDLHREMGEAACEPCKEAKAAYSREYRARKAPAA